MPSMVCASSELMTEVTAFDVRWLTCALLTNSKLLNVNSDAAEVFLALRSADSMRLNTCAVRGCVASLNTSSTIGLKNGGCGGVWVVVLWRSTTYKHL